jgi:RNA polymerase primary sigma factor
MDQVAKGRHMSEEKQSQAPVLGDEVKEIIDRGRQKGFLTYEEMNSLLPDDAVSPEYIDEILLALDQKGIDLIDENAMEEGAAAQEGAEEEEAAPAEEEERTGGRPRADVPHPDGRDTAPHP